MWFLCGFNLCVLFDVGFYLDFALGSMFFVWGGWVASMWVRFVFFSSLYFGFVCPLFGISLGMYSGFILGSFWGSIWDMCSVRCVFYLGSVWYQCGFNLGFYLVSIGVSVFCLYLASTRVLLGFDLVIGFRLPCGLCLISFGILCGFYVASMLLE